MEPLSDRLGCRVSRVLQGILGLVMVLFLSGCGEEAVCGGTKTNGLCVTVDSIISSTSTSGASNSPDVDAVQNADCDGDATTNDPETFTAHRADVTFSARTIAAQSSDAIPDFVTITSYTITYSLDPGSTSGPSLTSPTFNRTIVIEKDETVTVTLNLVEIAQKNEYVTGVGGSGNANPPRFYTATYTFAGTDQFGHNFTLTGRFSFSIGNFDNC